MDSSFCFLELGERGRGGDLHNNNLRGFAGVWNMWSKYILHWCVGVHFSLGSLGYQWCGGIPRPLQNHDVIRVRSNGSGGCNLPSRTIVRLKFHWSTVHMQDGNILGV